MYNKTTNLKEFQLIESIIIAFRRDFICAIKRNLHDSFVVAQLSACLLEQFSGFLYSGPVSVRVQQFLYEYMEPYGELELYEILRNSLDLKMPERLGTIMTGIPGRLLKNGYVGLDERSVIEVFSNDLNEAVHRAAADLRSDEQKKQQALVWVRDHPVYEWNSISLYTSEQESRLIDYYTPLLEKHNMFSTNTPLSFGFNFSDGGYLIAVLIDHFGGRKETTRVPLEIFIELLGLKRPEQVLSEED
jgi:hypothetical protein